MAYWLFKSDPDTYGFPELMRDQQTVWDGVSNPVALKHLRACRTGDTVLIYHTGDEKAVVGVAEVIHDPYEDAKNPKLSVVEIKAIRPLKQKATLAEAKAKKELADFALVRQPRLSVMPVSEEQWKILMEMAGEE